MIPKILVLFPEDIHKEVNSNFSKKIQNIPISGGYQVFPVFQFLIFFSIFLEQKSCAEIDRVKTANIWTKAKRFQFFFEIFLEIARLLNFSQFRKPYPHHRRPEFWI